MGAYLSEPITEKISSDGDGERLKFGASSMQGWRVSQEDAHNCILDFDKDTSLFAVYDGHGGHEVAVYTSQKLPEFIKNTLAYKKEDIENALIDAFLEFDGTIAKKEVIEILREIAGSKNDDSEEMSEEENISHLCEEASLPIEQVIEKYQSGVANPTIKKLQGGNTPNSPYLRAKSKNNIDAGCSGSGAGSSGMSGSSSSSGSSGSSSGVNSDQEQAGSSGSIDGCSASGVIIKSGDKCDTSSDVNVVSSTNSEVKKENGSGNAPEASLNGENAEVTTSSTVTKDCISPDSSNAAETDSSNIKKEIKNNETENKDEQKSKSVIENDNKEAVKTEMNGDAPHDTDNDKTNANNKADNVSSSTTATENGEVSNSSPKGKGKAKMVKKISESRQKLRQRTLRIRNAHQLYTKLLDMEESDSEDENDETFDGGEDFSSSELENDVNESDDADDEEENVSEEDVEDEEVSEDLEDDDEEDEVDDDDDEFARNIQEDPGSDSGCTAVVALVKGNKVYVANAGDSRCIICRDGQAIEMSLDHKPEDDLELQRIKSAGGKVTQDGRVNGGLNLSRAIGDHAYKQNKDLSDREQMITALPDVKVHELNEKDEFMVLACDGIWNYMSSQEVVEFVRPRLAENQKLSTICEEMFDHCLAPNTMGDGTGCDNMTAIIVKLNNNNIIINKENNVESTNHKRSASPTNENSENSKRLKIDTE